MSLREDLLNPIDGESPSGQNLRYAPVYDQIKEARREEVDVTQGIWTSQIKKADWGLVAKLSKDSLAKKTKDLQLAAWLTEAMVRREGIAGLHEGLDLIEGLLENFWDTLHPELEDGDAGMRAGILDWVGGKLDEAVKRSALTAGGLDWFDYREQKSVPSEEEANSDQAKAEARQAAIEEGKLTPEDFAKDFRSTPLSYYSELVEEIDATQSLLRQLENGCDEKFGELAPSFTGLRKSIDEFGQTARVLLERKREESPGEAAEEQQEAEEAPAEEYASSDAPVAAAPARRAGKSLSAEPADRDDAVSRVIGVARYMRREEPYSPVPYLMLRGLRWGELRANGESFDQSLLEAPPGEIRQQIKRLSMDSQWQEVLEVAETAMGMPCGRGWLDLQRYVSRACYELGSYYEPIDRSVKSETRALLLDFPSLSEMMMMDDTPTANPETQGWLKELLPQPEAAPAAEPEAESWSAPPAWQQAPPEADAAKPEDANTLALAALQSGRTEEAMSILSREISLERTGRGRFLRRVQLAQVCLSARKEPIAYPILRDLSGEIEHRKLDEWESAELLAQPLVLLYKCMTKMHIQEEERQRIYERICRLDPVQAMACTN
jgi:type VI secretion system protein ImpA